jgi:RNA polymerase sigma factor (sigma-70 family)
MGEMQSKSDAQLLREYAEHGAEVAFAEIVTRHTNLVYSAALRQMVSPDMAAEVAQGVFIGLARGARTLSPRLCEDASLAGWLCRSARNISLNLRRDEFRQHTRERQAMENLDPASETAPDWEHLRPVLDETMSELSEPDYDALVMRFFNNQDLRTIGRALGVTEDTAQKRVSRALDKLRELLSRRGISSTAAALSIVLSTHAVQAAPAGLAATISTAAALAGTAVSTPTLIATTKIIAMTTLQKALIVVTTAAVIGAGVYEARQNSILRGQVQTLQQQMAPLSDQIRGLQQDRDGAAGKLAALQQENEKLKGNLAQLAKLRAQVAQLRENTPPSASDPAGSTMKSWLARVNQLKARLQQTPGAKIPEFSYLTEQDYFDAAKSDLNTDEDYRRALSNLRTAAENDFIGNALQPALKQYAQANNGQFPTDLAQLQQYFNPPVDPSVLQRWQVSPQSALPGVEVGGSMVTQVAPVDSLYDARFAVGMNGVGSRSSDQWWDTSVWDTSGPNTTEILKPAMMAYMAANNAQSPPSDPSQLTPYLTTPEQQIILQNIIQKRGQQ